MGDSSNNTQADPSATSVEATMSAEERRRTHKMLINGEYCTELEWEERERQRRERQAAYLQTMREQWVQTPQGKLCLEFYQKFQEYKEYLETHPFARERADRGPLSFVEHALFEHGLKVMREYERDRAETDHRNLERARRAARCEHRHADGRRCCSPRMRGKRLCYMHEQIAAARAASRELGSKMDLGPLEDAASIRLAIVKLQRAVIDGTIDPRQSGLLAYLIQLAAMNAKNIKPVDDADEFESAEEDEESDEVDVRALAGMNGIEGAETISPEVVEIAGAPIGELPPAGA